MININTLKRIENQLYLNQLCDNKNNIDGNIAHLRDTYLTSENEHLYDMLKKDEIKDLISEANHVPVELLYNEAERIMFMVDNNLILEDKMNGTELKLLILLGAIQDKVLEKELRQKLKVKQRSLSKI